MTTSTNTSIPIDEHGYEYSSSDYDGGRRARIRVFLARLRRMTTSMDTSIPIDEHGYDYASRDYDGGRRARIRVFFARLHRMTTSTDTSIPIDEHGYGNFSRGYAGGRRIWIPVILSRFRRKTTSLWKLMDTNSLLLIWLTLGPKHISCSANNARKVEGKVLWDLGAEQCITSRVCAKWYGVMSSI